MLFIIVSILGIGRETVMTINIATLNETYAKPTKDNGWLIIGDSKSVDDVIEWGNGAAEGSNGYNGTAWKIHISIDPEKMKQAVEIIGNLLNEQDAPQVTIKFTSELQAETAQPSKQVAFKFYVSEHNDHEKMTRLLERIDHTLWSQNIGVDPRQINSDLERANSKHDATILNIDGSPSRFNYRFENAIVMDDTLYRDCGGTGNTTRAGQQHWIQQSYFLSLPLNKRHNPSGEPDPFQKLHPTPYAKTIIRDEVTPALTTEVIPDKKQQLLEKLRLDFTKDEHQDFWTKKVRSGGATYNGKKVPHTIRNVLKAINKYRDSDYQTFKHHIEIAIHARSGSWSSFFGLNGSYRSTILQSLKDSPDIENIEDITRVDHKSS